MDIIRFVARLRMRKTRYSCCDTKYEILVPLEIVNRYGLKKGELVEVILKRFGVVVPAWLAPSFELFISNLYPELGVLCRVESYGYLLKKKYIDLLREKLFKELVGYVGGAQNTSSEEDIRYVGRESEESEYVDQ